MTTSLLLRALLLPALLLGVAGSSGATARPASPVAARPAAGPVAVSNSAPAPAAANSRFTVVGVGDSVTAGTACDCEDFVRQYADLLRRSGRPVAVDNDGVAGLTSAGLRRQLESGRSVVRRDVQAGDVVLITIGANDLSAAMSSWSEGGCDERCAGAALPALRRNLQAIVADVRGLRAGRPSTIVLMDYWNVFKDGVVARNEFGAGYLGWSDQVTRSANAVICAVATSTHVTCLDTYVPFKGDGSVDPTPLLAGDGDHPNAAGHAAIARVIAAALRRVG